MKTRFALTRQFAFTLSFIAAACSPSSGPHPSSAAEAPPAPLLTSGAALKADGSPLKGKSIQIRYLGDGTNLFPDGANGCSHGDPHAQALQTSTAVTNDDGSYQVVISPQQFVRATDRSCPTVATRLDQFTGLEVKAQTDTDGETCAAYCAARSQEGSCVDDCTQHGQKFVWMKTYTQADLAVFQSQGLHETLVFNTLGPTLSDSVDQPAPDLQIDAQAAAMTAHTSVEIFDENACAVVEGCLGGAGTRKLLRFDGVIRNLGNADLVLGSPANNSLFEYSPCHGHYHLKNMMLYELVDPGTGAVVATGTGQVVGHKQGFCLEDMDQVAGQEPPKYTCDDQGITAGWTDIYAAALDCQWIDVTGVTPGGYILRLTVNPDGVLQESDRSNNTAEVPVAIE